MNQIIVVVLSFLLIPLLIRLKFSLSITLLISAVVLGIISGIGFVALSESVVGIFINSQSRSTILVVMMVSILGGLMKHYGILNKIVDYMQSVIFNKKYIVMIIPALIGVLIIPGGAILSAPFVNDIGKEMKLIPARRAAINLVFRHIAMFVMPYSTSILIIPAVLPDINIALLILLNSFFVICMLIIAYFLYLADVKIEPSPPKENIIKNLVGIAIYTSPIYACVIITVVTGLPFYLTMLLSIGIVYILGNKKDFLKNAVKSINWNIVGTVIVVLLMQEIILKMDDLLAVFNNMFYASNSMITILSVFLFSSLFFGFVTGYQAASLAIILPLISQLDVSIWMLHIYTYFAFCSTFIGYFFSPLHLCQAFTVQLMGVPTSDLYKQYPIFALALTFILVGSAFVLKAIFG